VPESPGETRRRQITTTTFDRETWGILGIANTNKRDDHGYVIPGSGDCIPCDCCGRGITIHVSIANADTKQTATIGKRCATTAGLKHLKYIAEYGDRYTKWAHVFA